MEMIGVAGDDIDIATSTPSLIGHDLRETRKVSLPLRADPGGDADLAVGLHLDPGALVGPDAGAFDITGDADADVTALRPQLCACSLLQELVVADRLPAPCRAPARNCRCRIRAARNP